jgi:membrane-bound inhibitor of C-type lysozyme
MMFETVSATVSIAAETYLCEDKTRLTATFQNPESGSGSVELVFHGSDKRVNLPQVLSADGGRYATGQTEFWIKGRQATLTRSDKTTTCKTEAE